MPDVADAYEVLRLPRTSQRPVVNISYTVLRQRAHTLRIPEGVFESCQTIGELQHVARIAFRTLAKRYHPDHSGGIPNIGYTFRRMVKAYHSIMRCAPQTLLQDCDTKGPLWKVYRQCCCPMGYDVAWEREIAALPPGWQYDKSGLCH